MRKFLLLCSALLFLCIALYAQIPKIWDKRYGGTSIEIIKTINSLENGKLIIGGFSSSNINGDKTVASYGDYDYWIVCADSNGNKLWDAAFGGNNDDELSAIIQAKDGGFLMGGSSTSGISGTKTQSCVGSNDYWVVKTDSLGNYQWDKRFGGTQFDELASICNTHDGGYLLAGSSGSGANGDKTQSCWGEHDFWVVKIDSLGTKLWDKRFGGTDDDICYAAYQISDHGYILSGYSDSGTNGDKSQISLGSYDYWAVRIDSVGTKIWDKRFGTSSADYARSGVSDGHDGVVIGGFTSAGINGDKTQGSWGEDDYWLVHVDSTGSKVWDARFGGDDDDDSYGNIFRTNDGGYLSTGTAYSDISGDKTQDNLGIEQTWMVKCSSTGSFVADRTLLTTGHEEAGFAIETKSGCIIMGNNTDEDDGGDKTQDSQGNEDYFIAKYCVPGMPVAGFSTTDTTVCQAQCITFNDASYNYPSAWSWSFPGGTPSSSTLQNPTICYNTVGTHEVKLITTNMSGADSILYTAYITVSQTPFPTITQNGTLLTCTPAAGTYQWYFNYVSIPGATNQSYTATQTGLYSVMVSNDLGCSAISQAFSFNINVALANFSASDTLICENSCLNFTDFSLNSPTGWAWSFPGAVPSSSIQQNPVNICYNAPGIYPVSLTVNNLYGSSTFTYTDYITVITVLSAPVITQFYDTLFCNSISVQYQWFHDAIPIPGATGAYYVMPVSGNYAVEITNAEGCTASTEYDAVIPLPGFAAQDSMICEKFCTNFFDLSTNNPVSWNWMFEGGAPSSSLQQNPGNICYQVPGIYDVMLITYDGYKYDTLFLESFMTVFSTPPLPSITITGDTLMSTPSTTYQWLLNEVEIPGATNQVYIATQSGVYTVITYSKDGCSAQVSIYFDLTSINSLNNDKSFEIFPNPGSGIFNLRFQKAEPPLSWYVNDMMGKIIANVLPAGFYTGKETILDLSVQEDGLYFIHVCYNDGCVVEKIIKYSSE